MFNELQDELNRFHMGLRLKKKDFRVNFSKVVVNFENFLFWNSTLLLKVSCIIESLCAPLARMAHISGGWFGFFEKKSQNLKKILKKI